MNISRQPDSRFAVAAKWIRRQLAAGHDVFVYFNNDAQGYAVQNAIELRAQLRRR